METAACVKLCVKHNYVDDVLADGKNLGGMFKVAKATTTTWPEQTISFHMLYQWQLLLNVARK